MYICMLECFPSAISSKTLDTIFPYAFHIYPSTYIDIYVCIYIYHMQYYKIYYLRTLPLIPYDYPYVYIYKIIDHAL
jgi:hypothetical protein